jgi:biotin carboxyl carrier protein
MPGTVIALSVAPGQSVAAGDPVVTVEAMKMEHTLRAPVAATVSEVLVAVGDRVALDDDLVRWAADHD